MAPEDVRLYRRHWVHLFRMTNPVTALFPIRNTLVLGASSFVGRRLMELSDPETVTGSYHSTAIPNGFRFDATKQKLTDLVNTDHGFTHAILLLGDTQPDSCFADPTVSRQTNVEGVKSVIGALFQLGIKPIFTSTEFVFDGETGNYTEADDARPILLYGDQKLEIEHFLQQSGEDFLICRLAKVFGNKINDGTLFSSWARQVFNGTERLTCARDQAFSPIFVEDVIQALAIGIKDNLSGLYHLSGGQRMTRLELLELLIAQIKKHRPVLLEIETCSIHDFDLPEKRPIDVSMKIDKLTSDSGFQPSDLEELCGRLVASWAS